MILDATNWPGIKLSVSNPKYINGELVSFIKGSSKQDIAISLGPAKVIKIANKTNEFILQLQDKKENLININKAITKISDTLINYCISKSANIWEEELSPFNISKKYVPILNSNKIKVKNNKIKNLNVGDLGELVVRLNTLHYNPDNVTVEIHLMELAKKKEGGSQVSENCNSECSIESDEEPITKDTSLYDVDTHIDLPNKTPVNKSDTRTNNKKDTPKKEKSMHELDNTELCNQLHEIFISTENVSNTSSSKPKKTANTKEVKDTNDGEDTKRKVRNTKEIKDTRAINDSKNDDNIIAYKVNDQSSTLKSEDSVSTNGTSYDSTDNDSTDSDVSD